MFMALVFFWLPVKGAVFLSKRASVVWHTTGQGARGGIYTQCTFLAEFVFGVWGSRSFGLPAGLRFPLPGFVPLCPLIPLPSSLCVFAVLALQT